MCLWGHFLKQISTVWGTKLSNIQLWTYCTCIFSRFIRKKKKSQVSGHRSASKSVWWCTFLFFFIGHLFFPSFFLPPEKYVIHCIHGDQISHIQSMVAKSFHHHFIYLFFTVGTSKHHVLTPCANTMCFISTIAKLMYRFWKEPYRTTRISTVTKWDYGSRENQYRATRFSTIPIKVRNMVQGEPWGLHRFFSVFRLACCNLRQENEEVWRCSSLSSIC